MTMVINKKAKNIIFKNMPEDCLLHDWWTYEVCIGLGKVIYDEIKAGNFVKAEELVQDGLKLSEELNGFLDSMINTVNEMTQNGEAVF